MALIVGCVDDALGVGVSVHCTGIAQPKASAADIMSLYNQPSNPSAILPGPGAMGMGPGGHGLGNGGLQYMSSAGMGNGMQGQMMQVFVDFVHLSMSIVSVLPLCVFPRLPVSLDVLSPPARRHGRVREPAVA